MEVREVTERFPCGEVEETFADYILVSWVMWLFFWCRGYLGRVAFTTRCGLESYRD